MKRLLPLLICVLFLTMLGSSAGAQEPFYLAPYMENTPDDPFIIDEGTEIVLDWAWLASTRGLINAFQVGWNADYTILDENGDAVFMLSESEAAALWQPSVSFPPAAVGLDCPMPKIWVAFWSKAGLFLDQGSYTLVTNFRKQPVTDGLHTCAVAETGSPVSQPPSKFGPDAGTWTVYFVVQ
jgi:hypothetical protein